MDQIIKEIEKLIDEPIIKLILNIILTGGLFYWIQRRHKRNDDFILKGKVLYQSEMTSILLESILYNNVCELPTISVSIQQHKPFLESLLSHWNKVHKSHIEDLPIT